MIMSNVSIGSGLFVTVSFMNWLALMDCEYIQVPLHK